MKALVIAEKPSVARDIARVLKCQKSLNGALEGDRYIVTLSLIHIYGVGFFWSAHFPKTRKAAACHS